MKAAAKRNQKLWRLALMLVVLILTAAWQFDASRRLEVSSDALVESVMYAAQHGLAIRTEGFGLGELDVENSDIGNDYIGYYQFHTRTGDSAVEAASARYSFTPYKSQVGIQGYLFGAVASVIRSHKLIWVYRGGVAFALQLVYLLIFLQLKKRYGLLLAGCFWALSVFSPTMTFFACSLYWLPVLWYIPMLLGLVCLNHPDKRVPVAVLMYAAVLVKCLCGYEFISTIMVCAVSFLCVEFIVDKPQRRATGAGILWLGTACLAGFATALGIHMVLYSGGGTPLDGFRSYYQDIMLREFGSADVSRLSGFWAMGQGVSAAAVLKAYFTQPVSGPAVLLVLLLGIGCLWYRHRHGEAWKRQAVMLGIHFLAPVTWFVLAKAHAYVHCYYFIALWYMGFMQVGIYVLADFVSLHRELFQKAGNQQSMTGPAVSRGAGGAGVIPNRQDPF